MTKVQRVNLGNDLKISRLVSGHWRLAEWQLSDQELLKLVQQTVELGITTFDHADIYGNYSCEKLFGNALALKRSLRDNIEIITKCGIKLKSEKYPERKLKVYDYSFDHIVESVENSLINLQTDRIDLLLLHRPAPLFKPEEVARAFSQLKDSGKVLHFGVSNFSAMQFEMLNSFTDQELITNQVEISPYCLEHFENGNMDFFLKQRIRPMAWSPLAGGKILKPKDEKGQRLLATLTEVAKEMGGTEIDKVVYSWLVKHPAGVIPILGTSKIERVQNAIDSLNLEIDLEQWYSIYNASTGVELP